MIASAAQQARQWFDEFKKKQLPAVSSAVQKAGNAAINFSRQLPANASNPISYAPKLVPIIQRAPIANQKFLPGQKKTINQVAQDVSQNFNNYNLYSQLAQGQLRSGIRPLDTAGQLAGKYVQNSFVNPLQTAINPRASLVDRGIGSFQAGFNLTPTAPLWNIGIGAAAGGLQTLRKGGNIGRNIANAITTPTSLAQTGLGIGETPIRVSGIDVSPALALGIDTLTSTNPKSLLKAGAKVKGLYRRPHADDARMLDQAADILQSNRPATQDILRARADLDALLKTYIRERLPKNQYEKLLRSGTMKQISVLQDFFKNADNPYQMGFAAKNQTIGSMQQARQAPDLTKYENAINSGDMKLAQELGKKYAGDARFQIHQRFGAGQQPKAGVKYMASNRTDMNMSTSNQKIDNLPQEKLPTQLKRLQKGASPTSQLLPDEQGIKPLSINNEVQLQQGIPPMGGIPPSKSDPSGRSIAQVSNSRNPYFNTNKLNIKPENKVRLNQTIQEVKPAIEKVVGKKLTNNEVIATANMSAKMLRKAVSRQQTVDFETALLNTRQKLAAMSESGTVDKEYLDTLITLKSHATDIGRKLQSFNIKADPKNITAKNAIMEAVTKVEKDTDKILKAADGVDFNDYNQATEFYRKFVKPTLSEKLDLLRYNSMLSSPNTHINNAFSNYLSTAAVAPIEKTVTGTLDFLKSAVTGKERQAFAGEGAAYAKGYAESLGEASHKFVQAFRGKSVSGNLDTRMIPLAQKGLAGKVEKVLSIPTRLLEASDQFFTALTSGGEKAALQLRKSKGVNVGNIDVQAADNAAYRLFRSELGDPKQGALLDGIDKVTASIQQLRSNDNPLVSNIAKFTLPFVRTPMNILKQGIEYSPAGIGTLPGAQNKTEQLSKTIIGSSAALATYLLASSGRTTWAEPTDPEAKQAFRAAGMQPYSLRIGDKWVSYAKLPPALSFNIALTSAIHDAQRQGTLDDGQVDDILSGIAKWGNFFADQSYLKNVGDLIASAKGDPERIASYWSNYPQQLVPFRATLGWIARTLDPYQRKIDPEADWMQKQVDLLKMQIPGISQQVSPRVDDRGNPIPNNNRYINAVSPVKITNENPEGKARYETRKTELDANSYIRPLKKEIDTQVDTITPRITNRVYDKIIAKGDFTEEQKQLIYEKVNQKVRTRVRSAIMRKRAPDILTLMKSTPSTSKEEKRIYLQKMRDSGLLNDDFVAGLSSQ